MHSNIKVWLAGGLLILSLFGCDHKPKESNGPIDKKITIGFSMATLLENRWIKDRDIFLAKAQQRGLEVIIHNANRDSDIQLQQVNDMLNQGIDVLVIAPNDCVMETRCVQAAKEQNVPVVVYDRLIYNSNADVYVSFDNDKVGQLMGEYMLEKAPYGGYILVNGPRSDNNCIMIRDGYMKVLQPSIDRGDITIFEETWTEGWVRELAYNFVSTHIPRYRNQLSAIICGNDSLAWGVTDALAETKLLESVAVVGMDADLVACQRIVKGKQGMTVYKPIQRLVEEALVICEKLANGEAIESDRTLFDGQYYIPYVAIDVKMVTKDTMDETVIQDGFHLRDEVYETVS